MALDRDKLMRDAQATATALSRGGFSIDGQWIDLQPSLERMKAGSRHYTPAELEVLPVQAGTFNTQIEVAWETTLSAVQRLLAEKPASVAVLNFASGHYPGGGFLQGSAAQEESLARASGLYAALSQHPEYYAPENWHDHHGARLYSDHLIYSPDVPVFRSEDGGWLAEPYFMDVLTAAAPSLRHLQGEDLRQMQEQVRPLLESRLQKMLTLFQARGCQRLVLGAWGCGAYRNDPSMVARMFGSLLEGPFRGAFPQVVFAIFTMDWETENLRAFRERFT